MPQTFMAIPPPFYLLYYKSSRSFLQGDFPAFHFARP